VLLHLHYIREQGMTTEVYKALTVFKNFPLHYHIFRPGMGKFQEAFLILGDLKEDFLTRHNDLAAAGIMGIIRNALVAEWKYSLHCELSPLGYLAYLLAPGNLEAVEHFMAHLGDERRSNGKRYPRSPMPTQRVYRKYRHARAKVKTFRYY
jgi:hypothetical protein